MVKLSSLIILLYLSSVFNCCFAQNTIGPIFSCKKKLQDQYGICTHISRKAPRYEFNFRDTDLSMIKSIGATYIRTDCDWEPLKTGKNDVLNFHDYDSVVMSVKRHKIGMLGIFTIDNRNYVTEDWRNFISMTARRYKREIRYWEILNESDLIYRYVDGFNMNNYASFLRNGFNAIKKENKKAKVLFSGLANISSNAIDTVLNLDVASYFDIMNIHVYTWKNWEPEDFIYNYQRLNVVMQKYNLCDKHLWVTETGCQNNLGEEGSRLTDIRLPRIFLISFAMGVDKVFWYKSRSCELDPNYNEDHFGLWHKDFVPKPAFYSYQTLIRMCPSRSTRPQLKKYDNVYMASWKRPDGKKVWALWTSKGDDTISLKIKGHYEVYDHHGEVKSDKIPCELKITPYVLYVIGAKDIEIEDRVSQDNYKKKEECGLE